MFFIVEDYGYFGLALSENADRLISVAIKKDSKKSKEILHRVMFVMILITMEDQISIFL